jgi:hypothetical protein
VAIPPATAHHSSSRQRRGGTPWAAAEGMGSPRQGGPAREARVTGKLQNRCVMSHRSSGGEELTQNLPIAGNRDGAAHRGSAASLRSWTVARAVEVLGVAPLPPRAHYAPSSTAGCGGIQHRVARDRRTSWGRERVVGE